MLLQKNLEHSEKTMTLITSPKKNYVQKCHSFYSLFLCLRYLIYIKLNVILLWFFTLLEAFLMLLYTLHKSYFKIFTILHKVTLTVIPTTFLYSWKFKLFLIIYGCKIITIHKYFPSYIRFLRLASQKLKLLSKYVKTFKDFYTYCQIAF